MPEKVEVLEDLGIILITSFGVVTDEDLGQSRKQVSTICRDRGLTKILVDATGLTSAIPIIDAFEHAAILSKDDIFKKAKHAIVASEPVQRGLQFIETAAFNRGAKLRVFTSREEALDWLKD